MSCAACAKACRLKPLKLTSVTSRPGLSVASSEIAGWTVLTLSWNCDPTIDSRTASGSSTSAGGVICCLSAEPFGILEVPDRELVDVFAFETEVREEERALNTGRATDPGAR